MRLALPSLLLLAASVGFAAATGPPSAPDLTEATSAYLRDPAGTASTFIETARRHGGELSLLQVLLLSDAAVRTGQESVARELALGLQQSSAAPAMTGALEMLLAWTALARGALGDASAHLEAATAADPALRPVAAPALGLVASARGLRDGPAMLAAAMALPDLDPAWREIAPLLDAYALYLQGDAARAADAFTAFAAADPNGRFADDALYAAARAKRRAGRAADAEADLLALAGDDDASSRVSRGLLALDPRTMLRDGVRRDRARGHRRFAQRFADLLDGDGVALARAALARDRRSRHVAEDEVETARAAGGPAGRASDGAGEAAGAAPGAAGARAGAPSRDAVAAAAEGDATTAPVASSAPEPAGRRWLAAAVAGALLLALALRRRARRRPRHA